MAQKKHTDPKAVKKTKGPQQKPGLGTRIRQFIGGLKNELKRVVWPDKKTLKQTAIAVAIIIALSAGMIFVVDSILGAVLRATGFDTPTGQVQTTRQTITETTTESTIDVTGGSEETTGEE